MAEYKIGSAIVRMHGKPDQEKIRAATERFLKQVEASRKRKKQKIGGTHGKRIFDR